MSKRKAKRRRKAAKRDRAKPATSGVRPAEAHRQGGTDSRLRPWLLAGVAMLVVAQPLVPGETGAALGHGFPLVMLWIVVAVVWLLDGLSRGRLAVRFGWTDAAVGLLIAWHTLAGIVGAARGSPRPAVNMLWQWIGLGVGFFMIRQLVTRRRDIKTVAAVMIALAVVLSCYGLYQYVYELGQWREQYAADPYQALREQEIAPGSAEQVMFEKRLASTEPIATFALTNSLAGVLVPWLVVLAGIGFLGARRPETRLKGGAVAAGLALPILACLVLTKSRSAYLAAASGVCAAWWVLRRRGAGRSWKLPVAAVGLILALAIGGILAGGLDRAVLTEATKSLGYRLEYWQSTLRMISHDPWFGCGPGNFQNEYTRYKLPQASEEVAEPHNFVLEVWATAGTPAALALLAVLAGFTWRLVGHGSRGAEPGGAGPAPCESDSGDPANPNSGSPARAEGGAPSAEAGPELAYLTGGAAAGLLLAYGVGLVAGIWRSVLVLTLGLPLGAASVAALWDWVKGGNLPARLLAIALAAMLIHLLAQGGIGFPSVAGSLWLLLALGLNVLDLEAAAEGQRGGHRLGSATTLGALGAAVVLAVAFYATAYSPVLHCRGALDQARDDPGQADRLLRQAAEADPLDPEPRAKLASLTLDAWMKRGEPAALDQFEQYNEAALALAPNDSALWLQSGQWYSQVHQRTGRQRDLDRAIASYQQSVALYPNSALRRAKLALACLAAGDESDFAEQATEALHLDKTTPHEDKKLDPALREKLADGLARITLSPN